MGFKKKNITITLDKAELLISRNKIERALSILINLSKESDYYIYTEYYSNFIYFSACINQIEDSLTSGIIDFETSQLERKRLIMGILSHINELKIDFINDVNG